MNRRPLGQVRRDLRALLEWLGLAQEMEDTDLVGYFVREIRALEGELDFNRYGRTDVQGPRQVTEPSKVT